MFVGISEDVVEHDGLARSDPGLEADVVSHRGSALTVLAKAVTFAATDIVVYALVTGVGMAVSSTVKRRCRWGSSPSQVLWVQMRGPFPRDEPVGEIS